MTQSQHAHKQTVTKRSGRTFLLLLLLCAVCVTPALAGAVTVDTAGLTGKVTDTILVPVVVSSPGTIVAWQLTAETGDFDTAKIVFNRDSVLRAGAASGDKVIYWFEAKNPANYIREDKTLFYLAVPPKQEGEIPLEIHDLAVYEAVNGVSTFVEYEAVNGNLLVSGMGTGNTIGDSESGATVYYGYTQNGVLITGEKTGLTKLDLGTAGDALVTIFWGSTAPYDLPETFSAAEKYTLSVDAADGTPVTLTMAVKKSFLTENGIESKDLIVLRNLFGSWYQSAVSNIIDDGTYVTFTVDTWTCGSAIAIGYDTAGTKYKPESKNFILSGGKDTGLDIPLWALIAGAGAIVLILVIVIIVVTAKKRKANRFERL